MLLSFRDASRDIARLLSFPQARDDLLFQPGMLHDLFPLVVRIFPPDMGLMVSFLRNVLPLHRIPRDFKRDRIRTSFHELRDMSERILLFQKTFDLPPVILRELPPCCVFFSWCHCRTFFAGRVS